MKRPVQALILLMSASLLGACASVDLGPRYDPPPVRMPPVVSAPASLPAPYPTPMPMPVPTPRPLPMPPADVGTPVTRAPVDAAAQDANANLVALTTQPSGAMAVPPTNSFGTARVDMVYDSRTRLLRWKASWQGLSASITAVNFHGPADLGQVAPLAIEWPGPFGSTYEGRATLTTQMANDLLEGLWYVNIVTRVHPAGELRGQLRVVN